MKENFKQKIKRTLCFLLSSILVLSSTPINKAEATDTIETTATTEIREYEVLLNSTARVFVSNDKAVDYTVGDKYYLTYTVSEIGGTVDTGGVATTTAREEEYPYNFGGGLKHTGDASMFTQGCTYTICVEVTESGRTYTVTKSDGTTSTDMSFSKSAGTIEKGGTTHFGLLAMGTAITGKLTNVKCYDQDGNDLGVWGNKTRNVIVDTVVDTTDVQSYEVSMDATANVFVGNNIEASFEAGEQYYLTYTVMSATSTSVRSGVIVTSDNTKQYPYEKGGMYYDSSSKLLEVGASYRIRVTATDTAMEYLVIKQKDGTRSILSFSTSYGDLTTKGPYFGIWEVGGTTTGKLVNVKCYDSNGNDLEVWGDVEHGVTATKNANLDSITGYDVTLSSSERAFISNATAVDFAEGDKYYLTYTVSDDISYSTTAGISGISITQDKTSEYIYTTGYFQHSAAGNNVSMLEKGYTYTICVEALAGDNRTLTATKTNGTDTATVTLSGGKRGTLTTADVNAFGLQIMGATVSGTLTNVKCYDQDGTDLGVYGNTTYNVTATKNINLDSITGYDVTLSSSERAFISNATDVDFAEGDKYYLTYTVSDDISYSTTAGISGISITQDKTSEYIYNNSGTIGYFKYSAAGGNVSMLEKGYTYTICVEALANNNRTLTATKTNGTDVATVTLSGGTRGTLTTADVNAFGLQVMGATVSGTLTNVKCYDQDGNDLGVYGNTTYNVTVEGTLDIDDVRAYDVYYYDARVGFVGNKVTVPFESGDKYYLTYTVEDAVSTSQCGIVVTTEKSSEYPYTSGGMYLNTGSGVLFDEGATYHICVTATDDKMSYEVVKTKDGTQTSLAFAGEIEDVTTKGLYFGIYIKGESTIAKLTDVQCYDASGNDLGVYSNTDYNVHTLRMGTEVEANSRETVFYNLEDGAFLITGHNVKVNCVEGQTTGSVTVDEDIPTLSTPGTYEIIRQEAGGFYQQTVVLYRIGDVNLDNAVTAEDLSALTGMLAATEEGRIVTQETAAHMAADLNNNEIVGAKDVELMTQITSATTIADELKAVKAKYHADSMAYDYLGGDEVMPIVAYYGPYAFGDYDYLTENVFELLKKNGVNLINFSKNVYTGETATKTLVRKMLELAEEHNIGYFVEDTRLNTNVDTSSNTLLGDARVNLSLSGVTATTNAPVSTKNLAGYLGDYSYFNSFLGTHVVDEPFAAESQCLTDSAMKRYWGFYKDLAKQLNVYGNAGGFVNLLSSSHTTYNGTDDYATWIGTYISDCSPQVLSFDVYPFFENATSADANGVDYSTDIMKTYFESLSVMREASVSNNIPFWSYVQAGGDYRDESGEDDAKTDDKLLPTREETLWNVNTSLAFGAKGIEWFTGIQPDYFSLDSTSADGHDYDRNGLIGADGTTTPFYAYAQEAHAQIAAVDEVLMKATSKGVIATAGYATTYTADATMISAGNTTNLKSVTSPNTTWGSLVGCFDYRDGEAYYVVNFDTTAEASQKITLEFNGAMRYRVMDADSNVLAIGTSVTLEIGAGEAVLVVAESIADANGNTLYNVADLVRQKKAETMETTFATGYVEDINDDELVDKADTKLLRYCFVSQ